MQTNLAQQVIEHNEDFLIGDVVVLTAPLTFVDRVFDTDDLLQVECTTVNGGIGIALHQAHIMCVDPAEIRAATVVELHVKRRLTEAEHSIAEVP